MEDDSENTQLKARDSQAELQALSDVVAALQRIDNNSVRERVLHAAAAFFKLSVSAPRYSQAHEVSTASVPMKADASFSEDRTIPPKDFLTRKQPQKEVERVACLAYYLTHYRDTPYFKTIDISSLNTEAAQPKFGNAAQAVENALKTRYLAAASKGAKQLSAAGELFVQALPDREAARTAMANMRPRRRKKSGQGQTVHVEQDSGD